jgi:Spy/CpxP family protein refolding chaperone
MRKSRVIGFVVASLVSVASFAQAQTATPNARQERRGEARGIEGRAGHGGRGGLFKGVTLSDAEKGRVKQVHAKYSTEAKALRQSLRPAMQEARAARQKGDTAGMKAAFNKTAGDREKLRALMQREKAEIRTGLSADNQRVFDANTKQLEQRRAGMKKNGKGGRAGHGANRGKRATQAS